MTRCANRRSSPQLRLGAALCTITLLLPGIAVSAQNRSPETWEREEAWRASASVDIQQQRSLLHALLKAGDSEATLDQIHEIEQQGDWPAPARERVLFEFASGLRQEPAHSVSTEIIKYLGSYESTVWVPHEDHPRGSVPLFNIKGATAGVVNHWTRQEAAFEGAGHLAAGGEILARAYQREASSIRRRGLSDALGTATPEQLKAVSELALKLMKQDPGMEYLAGRAALLNKDFNTLEQLVRNGHGTQMASLFRQCSQIFDAEQTSRLLLASFQNDSSETAALAIAQLSPLLTGHQPTQDLLLKKLGDPELGSSAALALAKNPGPALVRKLEALAASGESSLGSSRARLALRIHDSQFKGKTQP